MANLWSADPHLTVIASISACMRSMYLSDRRDWGLSVVILSDSGVEGILRGLIGFRASTLSLSMGRGDGGKILSPSHSTTL